MKIREAVPADFPRVAELTLAAYRSLPGRVGRSYERHLVDVAARAEADSTIVLVAEDGADVVGAVTLVLDDDEEWFEHTYSVDGDCAFRMLAVDPAHTGEGVGRLLVEECIQRCRAARRHRIVITTMPWMTTAHRMYERLGFQRRPDLDLAFDIGTGMAYTLDVGVTARPR